MTLPPDFPLIPAALAVLIFAVVVVGRVFYDRRPMC